MLARNGGRRCRPLDATRRARQTQTIGIRGLCLPRSFRRVGPRSGPVVRPVFSVRRSRDGRLFVLLCVLRVLCCYLSLHLCVVDRDGLTAPPILRSTHVTGRTPTTRGRSTF